MKKNLFLGGIISLLLSSLSTETFADQLVENNKLSKDDRMNNYQSDNSGVNIRDRKEYELTADDQSNEKSDTELVSRIRKALVDEESLSLYAENIKLISNKGIVHLKGPVRSNEEVKKIEIIAENIAGKGNVVNQLEVTTKTKS